MNKYTLTLLTATLAITGGILMAPPSTHGSTPAAATAPQASAPQQAEALLPAPAAIVLPTKLTIINNLPAPEDGTSGPVYVYKTDKFTGKLTPIGKLINSPSRRFINSKDNQIEITPIDENVIYSVAYSSAGGTAAPNVWSKIPRCVDQYVVPGDLVENSKNPRDVQMALRKRNDDCDIIVANKRAADKKAAEEQARLVALGQLP